MALGLLPAAEQINHIPGFGANAPVAPPSGVPAMATAPATSPAMVPATLSWAVAGQPPVGAEVFLPNQLAALLKGAVQQQASGRD